jgi:hypothetical protein
MRSILKLLFVMLLASQTGSAQVYVQPLPYSDYSLPFKINIGNGVLKQTTSSAYLEIGPSTGATRGLLLPRLTTTERNAVGSPAVGLMIYNKTTNRTNIYTTTGWADMPTSMISYIDTIYFRADSMFYQKDSVEFFVKEILAGGGSTPAGNNGNVQIKMGSALATPGGDSLDWNDAGGYLDIKGGLVSTTTGAFGTSVTTQGYFIKPSYISNWAASFGYTGNGVSAKASLSFREYSDGSSSDMVTIEPVNAITGSRLINIPDEDGTFATREWVTANPTGVTTFAALTDVNLTSLATNDFLKWDGTDWINRTPANVRTDLSLVVGTNVQAYDADLTTYAGITPSANVQSILGAADYSAIRTLLGLVIGTNVQAYDADLSTWAGLTPTTVGQNLVTLTNPSALGYIRVNADNTVTHRSYANVKTDLSLNNVENTALSTWAGSTNITTLGTIATGTWAGTDISNSAFRQSAGLSVVGRSANTTGDVADITGTDGQVLRVSGTTLGFGTVANAGLANSAITINGTSVSLGGTRTLTLASADFANQGTTTTVLHGNAAGNPTWGAISLSADVSGDLPFANLTQIAGFSVLGKTGTGTGDVAAITAGVDGVFRRSGSGDLSFGTLVTNNIGDAQVTLAKLADVATATVFYRKTAGTGVPEVQTLATLKTDLGLTGTNSGDQTITLTGDVTGSGTGSFAATIADNSVDGTDIALGSDAQGDVMYYDGTNWVRLPAGTSGHFLKTQGAGANPMWDAAGGSVSEPSTQIVVGTGSGVDSYSGFKWENSTGVFTLDAAGNSLGGMILNGTSNPNVTLKLSGTTIGYSPIIVSNTDAFFTGAVSGDMGFRSEANKILFGVATASGSLASMIVGSNYTKYNFETIHELQLTVKEIAAPSTPSSGYGSFYVKTDGLPYFKNDAGTEYDLTAGGGGGETNTASNLGGGLANWDSKSGVDLRFNTFDAGDFNLASNLITIDNAKWATIAYVAGQLAFYNSFNEVAITSNATWSPTGSARENFYDITAQAAAVTTISNPSGTAANHNVLVIRVEDNGTARAISGWGSEYRFSGSLPAPTTTTLGKVMYMKFIYNSTDTKWDLISVLDNF